jgi:hypothetical protein
MGAAVLQPFHYLSFTVVLAFPTPLASWANIDGDSLLVSDE